jgi:hypothetical protein
MRIGVLFGRNLMKHFTSPARHFKQAGTFARQLDAYSLAAGAAGVSLLALAAPSEAKIVYTHVHKVIKNEEHYNLDFNHDRSTDLSIRNIATQYCSTDGNCQSIESLGAAPSRANEVVYNIYGAVAMKPGMTIGPRCTFKGGVQRMVWSFGDSAVGSWINVKNRYLGVKFHIKGKTHYGWARLSVKVQPKFNVAAALTGYAYETTPNKPIIAGKTKGPDVITVQPATLGHLARGESAIRAWRVRESK